MSGHAYFIDKSAVSSEERSLSLGPEVRTCESSQVNRQHVTGGAAHIHPHCIKALSCGSGEVSGEAVYQKHAVHSYFLTSMANLIETLGTTTSQIRK